MQSVWTEATVWFASTLSDEDAEEETRDARSNTASGDGKEVHGPGRRIGRPAREIMTPEERVVQLVSENDGGMKQADIVSAVEWSESTVSRKLSTLEAAGTITRYRIGREKLVFLPGSEPESLGSPFREAPTDGLTQA